MIIFGEPTEVSPARMFNSGDMEAIRHILVEHRLKYMVKITIDGADNPWSNGLTRSIDAARVNTSNELVEFFQKNSSGVAILLGPLHFLNTSVFVMGMDDFDMLVVMELAFKNSG